MSRYYSHFLEHLHRIHHELTPEKLEMIRGRLLWDGDDRVKVLGLLLENVGADRAVELGDPTAWRAAVDGLKRE